MGDAPRCFDAITRKMNQDGLCCGQIRRISLYLSDRNAIAACTAARTAWQARHEEASPRFSTSVLHGLADNQVEVEVELHA